jgi:hypothetical protein
LGCTHWSSGGGLIAGLSAWLNAWIQSARENRNQGLDQRHRAYVEFLFRSQNLYRGLEAAIRELEPASERQKGRVPVLSETDEADLDSRYVEYRRAQLAVALVAPSEIMKLIEIHAVDSLLEAVSNRDLDGFAHAVEAFSKVSLSPKRVELVEAMRRDLEK